MRFRRAPRKARRRRNRKFTARPTSHDGLSVIVAYGNRPGYTADGRASGRSGNNEIVCRDGYQLSVIAGWQTHSLPRPDRHVPSDYRGPYSHLELMVQSPPMLPEDPDAEGPYEAVHVAVVRALIELHGGFARMLHKINKRAAWQAAQITAQVYSGTARARRDRTLV